MDFTQHYLDIAATRKMGEMSKAIEGDVILVPHRVTKTPGNSTRLQPSMEFPSVRLSKYLQNTEFGFLKSTLLFNGNASLPSKISEMLLFTKPFDANIIRQELRSLKCSEIVIEAFLDFFPLLQQKTLGDSKVAQAGKIMLEWKNAKVLYENRIMHLLKEQDSQFSMDKYMNAAEVFKKETEMMQQDLSMDHFFSDYVHQYDLPTKAQCKDSLHMTTMDVLLE